MKLTPQQKCMARRKFGEETGYWTSSEEVFDIIAAEVQYERPAGSDAPTDAEISIAAKVAYTRMAELEMSDTGRKRSAWEVLGNKRQSDWRDTVQAVLAQRQPAPKADAPVFKCRSCNMTNDKKRLYLACGYCGAQLVDVVDTEAENAEEDEAVIAAWNTRTVTEQQARELRAALTILENACDQRAALIPQEIYNALIAIQDMEYALNRLDSARRVARAALAATEQKEV